MRWGDKIQNQQEWAPQHGAPHTCVLPVSSSPFVRSLEHSNVPFSECDLKSSEWAAAESCWEQREESVNTQCAFLAFLMIYKGKKISNMHRSRGIRRGSEKKMELLLQQQMTWSKKWLLFLSQQSMVLDKAIEAEEKVSTWAVSSLVRVPGFKDKRIIQITKRANTHLMLLCWSELFFLHNWYCTKSETQIVNH